MKTKKLNIPAKLKYLSVLPVIILMGIFLLSCSARKKISKTQTEIAPPPPPPPPAQATDEAEEPYVVVEEMPMFPGGDSALISYIAKNIRYPESSKKQGIQGKVIARFCVEKNGSVGRVSVLRSVSPELDAEAVRVVSTLPAFLPGKQGGRPVPVWYMVPIAFALK